MMRTQYNKKIGPLSDGPGNFLSDDPVMGNIVQGFYVGFFEHEESVAALASYLGDELIELESYSNPAAGNGMGHSGTFVRFRTESHTIEDVRALVATLN